MDTNWLNHPSLQKMHPAKKQIVLEFIRDAQGKSMDKGMKSMMNANAKMKALGLSFDQDETNLITSILMSNMPPEQRTQAELMMNMMNGRGKPNMNQKNNMNSNMNPNNRRHQMKAELKVHKGEMANDQDNLPSPLLSLLIIARTILSEWSLLAFYEC